MGIRFPLRSQSKSPEQYAKETRPDLFFDQLPQNPPTETVEAAPVSSDEYGDLGGNVDESQSPDYVGNPIDIYGDVPPSQSGAMPDQSVPPSPFGDEPETDEPETETPAKPSSEPGRTAALETAQTQQPEDEYEKLFKEYGKAQEEYRAGSEALSKESEAANRQQILMTGVAGALQSFGEGLAAITGGSAKPIQTAAESVRRMGEAGAAEREGKAKTLKERLMMARQPLEAKAEQDKFRTVFEDRQRKQRLTDPASTESKQARELANNFLDAYIASVGNRTDETQIAKIEAIRPRLENLNANQIKDFVDNLNKLKFTESKSELEDIKASYKQESEQAKAKQQAEKTKGSQEFKVQRDTYNKISKIESVYQENNKFYTEYNNFKTNVDKAVAGDTEARKWVKANKDAFGYIISRTKENRGVFTDQDAATLDTLFKTETWAMKFKAWVDGGLKGEIPLDSLKNLQDVLKTMKVDNPLDIRNDNLKRAAKIARASDDGATQNSASYFERLIESEPVKSESDAPSIEPKRYDILNKEPEIAASEKSRLAKDKKDFKDGSIVIIGNTKFKVRTKNSENYFEKLEDLKK